MKNCFDIAVVGGGVAGVSAALAAARQGKKVVVIEKQCILGGLATSGLITIYLPICDGKGHQVSFGIAEELLKLSIKMGCQRKYPKPWLENGSFEEKMECRYEAQFNPYYFSFCMEELLLQNNVKILYDATLIDVNTENKSIKSLVIDTFEGTKEIKASCFVDATGDAKLCYLAHSKTRKYLKGNTLANWYYFVKDGKLELKKFGTVEKSKFLERTSEEQIVNDRYIGGDYEVMNSFLQTSHSETLKSFAKEKQRNSSFEVVSIPMMPDMRMTRCIDGEGAMILDDDNPYAKDSIGVVADWRRRGFSYEMPFTAICADGLHNVFVAGRCIKTDDEMWDVTRAIPACAVSGEASGLAASLYAKNKCVDIKQLQQLLKDNGQVLSLDEALKNH